jgi:hypothetical protein
VRAPWLTISCSQASANKNVTELTVARYGTMHVVALHAGFRVYSRFGALGWEVKI